MTDEILQQVRVFAESMGWRVFVLARNPRLRVNLIGDTRGISMSRLLEEGVQVPGYTWLCTSGSHSALADMNFTLWQTDENPWKKAADSKKSERDAAKLAKERENSPYYKYCGPHCDSRVLHRPTTCKECDMFPIYQHYREILAINYTGESDPKKSKCPAEIARPLSNIERWYGNVRVENPGHSLIIKSGKEDEQ